MKFFTNCANLDELKRAYKAAARLNHPDVGGDTATMQKINAEYADRFEFLKKVQNDAAQADDTGKTRATTETAGEFIDIINHLLTMDGLTVELVGSWLWCSGNTAAHKDALKAIGFKWSPTKKMWHWHHPEPGDHWRRGNKSMAAIRQKYGSTVFERGETREPLTA